MEPILTIAIPTFNRPNQIQKQVRLLLPQINKEVELVVYDNCSEVPVRELFIETELLLFQITRNRVNVGGDANIARCFENCLTKWLWTLSDDDYVKTNAIEIALGEIKKNINAVFVNFWSDPAFITTGFDELAFRFREARVYSNSFTMSNCAYNISLLGDSLQDYYNNLSSMTGTLILVLKYVQRVDSAVCVFTDKNAIGQYNTMVGWNYGLYVSRSFQFIDTFKRENNRKYDRTLFLGCHKTNYLLIVMNRKESQLSYIQRWKVFAQIVHHQGLFKAIIYTPEYLIYAFLSLIFQQKRLKWVIKGFRKFLNNNKSIIIS